MPTQEDNQVQRKKLTEAEIIEHLKTAKWVELCTLFNKTEELCVDGRGKCEAVGTPGGNMGEFILALASAEKISVHKFSEEEVKRILSGYINSFGNFYWHTDTHATHALGHDFDPMNVSDDKLDELVKPEAIGCGHVKLMLTEGEAVYGVRKELIEAAIKAVYRLARERKDIMDIEILEGEHEEGAVLVIEINGKFNNYTKIPTVQPFDTKTETFVYHPSVVKYMRETTAGEFLGLVEEDTGAQINKADFIKVQQELGEQMTMATIGRLAKGLPMYQAKFVNGKWEVKYIEDVD